MGIRFLSVDNKLDISQKCAEFVCNLSFDMLPIETITAAKRCFFDWFGCVVAGSETDAGKISTSYAIDNAGSPCSTLLAKDYVRLDVVSAAFANAYNCHILEMDDVHRKSIMHPAAPIISVSFALAEKLSKSGKELIESIVAGYDVALRIGEAVTPSHYKLWHTTATCGTFGAAMAAAKLCSLDEKQTLDALGNAGTSAAGLWQFAEDGAMSKYLHCGNAARSGLTSGLLAAKGLTGATRILEGEKGFFKAYSSEKNFSSSFDDMGQKFKIEEVSFKPYPSCRHTHSSVDAAIKIHNDTKYKQLCELSSIERIDVEIYSTAIDIAGNKTFETPSRAKFSLYYCIAYALLYGELTTNSFSKTSLSDPKVILIANKIVLIRNAEFDESYPASWKSSVCVRFNHDGCQITETIATPKGDPENKLSDKELFDKINKLSPYWLQTTNLSNMVRSISEDVDLSTFIHRLG